MDKCHECSDVIEKLNEEFDKIYEEKESYKSKLNSQNKIELARNILLKIYPKDNGHNRHEPGWINYPLVDRREGTVEPVWDEITADGAYGNEGYIDPPTINEIKEHKYGNVIDILDFAYSYKGWLKHGIIIYDTEPVSDMRKLNIVNQINNNNLAEQFLPGFKISEMKADDILNSIINEKIIININMERYDIPNPKPDRHVTKIINGRKQQIIYWSPKCRLTYEAIIV